MPACCLLLHSVQRPYMTLILLAVVSRVLLLPGVQVRSTAESPPPITLGTGHQQLVMVRVLGW